MSKENNLKDYLKDLYQGIVSKKPDASKNPQHFRSEIESIEGDGNTPVFDGTIEIDGEPLTPSTDYYEEGYNKGYEAGKSEGVVPNVPAESAELLSALPFLTKAGVYFYDNGDTVGYYGFIVGSEAGDEQLAIVPPWVTEVEEYASDALVNCECAIFAPKTPPMVGWQGMWSSDGGSTPPTDIFVPDESIDAYKATTNLAEFADIIKPLSEYNGEGYRGDWQW